MLDERNKFLVSGPTTPVGVISFHRKEWVWLSVWDLVTESVHRDSLPISRVISELMLKAGKTVVC